MERTIDYIRACPGYWQHDDRGRITCRIEVYEHPGLTRWWSARRSPVRTAGGRYRIAPSLRPP